MDWTLAQNGIEHQHHSDFDHIFWSNRKASVNRWMLWGYVALLSILFLIIAPSLRWLFLSQLNDLTPFEKFSYILYTLFWCILFLQLSKTFLSFLGQEQIKIANNEIILDQSALFTPKSIHISTHELECISFQKYPSGNFEPFLTLNFVFKREGRVKHERIQLARWMRREEKHHLFQFIKTLLEKRNWEIDFVDDSIKI